MATKHEKPPLCGLTEAQVDALLTPLAQEHVATREGKFDYIEGHHAIREANRIFGPAGWTRETISMECVYAGEYKGRSKSGWQSAYVAKVRVTVRTDDGWVVREGTGYGDAIDYNSPAPTHEGASKEAETDAMKRALMSFGDPFGLALYDKERKHVARGEQEAEAPAEVAPAYTEDGYPLTAKALAAWMADVLGITKADLGPMRAKAAELAWGGPPEDWKALTPAQWGELARALDNLVNGTTDDAREAVA